MQSIYITKPHHFIFSESLYFLDRGYDDCLYEVDKESVKRAITIETKEYLIEVREEHKHLAINILNTDVTENHQEVIKQYVTEWFDLKRDLNGFYKIIDQSKLKNTLKVYTGLRLVAIPDLFEALCWSIIGQQINLTFAYSLKRRLVELCNNEVSFNGKTYYSFPSPIQIAKLTIETLREKQFSQRKAEYLIGLAKLFEEESVKKEDIASLGETKKMVDKLCQIRGIGEWSANYALMKSLGRMDCITHGDTGLQAAIRKELNLDRKPTKDEVINFLTPYAGWESYIVFYLWRSLS